MINQFFPRLSNVFPPPWIGEEGCLRKASVEMHKAGMIP